MRLPKGQEEKLNREAGLQKTIDSTNKGFEMLKKMGYKQGKYAICFRREGLYSIAPKYTMIKPAHFTYFRLILNRGKSREIEHGNC